MPSQSFAKWFPIQNIPENLGEVFILQPSYIELVVVCYGEFPNDQVLILTFEGVEAFCSQEELTHQWLFKEDLETIPMSPQSRYTFPFLTISNSLWAQQYANSYLGLDEKHPMHFCVISRGFVTEVLAFNEPVVTWQPTTKVDDLLSGLSALTGN